jgi:RimJ/RimL family protein N-acetyltransferase
MLETSRLILRPYEESDLPDKAEAKYHDGQMKERLEYSLDKSEA